MTAGESFELSLFTSPEDFADECELIDSLFGMGLARLHVKKPRGDEHSLSRWLLSFDAPSRSKMILHGYPQLAAEYDLGGFAMDSAWFATNAERFAGRPLLRCAVATSSADLRPVPGSDCIIFEPDEFSREGTAALNSPVHFAGSVDVESLPGLKKSGFAGAVALESVWNYADPLRAWRNLYGG